MKKIIIIFIVIFILFLSFVNLSDILFPRKIKVLGTQTEIDSSSFWKSFLNKHPEYIPGWNELGRTDKVKQIDPNYPQ